MNLWNQLLTLLDHTLGFPNKMQSSVNRKSQHFDQRTNEHVFVLEYRIKVLPGFPPSPKGAKSPPRAVPVRQPVQSSKMNLLQELMDVKFVHTVDSHRRHRPAKRKTQATTKVVVKDKKIRPKPPQSPKKLG